MTSSITTQILSAVLNILCFVPAIVVHEVSHGWAAYKLGDPTAKRAGRLSLNPLKHIDIFGTVILPLILMFLNMPVFGYAKPVPYNPTYFKDPRKGDLVVGLAGPASNLIMGLIGAAFVWLAYFAFPTAASENVVLNTIFYVFFPMFVMTNFVLMMFNLIPIPPLDGSSIIAPLIPMKHLHKYYKIQSYAMPIFMIVILVLPYIIGINPISLYLNATAGNLTNLVLP